MAHDINYFISDPRQWRHSIEMCISENNEPEINTKQYQLIIITIFIRQHRSTTQMWPIVTDRVALFISQSVTVVILQNG